jgi:hypothetical protein
MVLNGAGTSDFVGKTGRAHREGVDTGCPYDWDWRCTGVSARGFVTQSNEGPVGKQSNQIRALHLPLAFQPSQPSSYSRTSPKAAGDYGGPKIGVHFSRVAESRSEKLLSPMNRI